MTLQVCCLWLSLVSANVSDSVQTSEFTRDGQRELNPIARPFVRGAESLGEIGLSLMGITTVLYLESKKTKVGSTIGRYANWVELAWLAAHIWGIQNNERLGYRVPFVAVPLIQVAF